MGLRRYLILLLCGMTLLALTSRGNASKNSNRTVLKQSSKKIYIHLMPWFETKETSEDGKWGQHWSMARMNPDLIVGEGNKRQIASHYYPDIQPYASGTEALIDYQIQMMKYAGADGVLMDWPGTTVAWDYPKNMKNADNFIQKLAAAGLEFAIVYEDHNLGMARDEGFITDVLQQGRLDMSWLQSNYFNMPNYIKINGAPLLLTFGPQTLRDSDWPAIFSPLNPRPTFLTLWNQMEQTAGTAVGEYPWIYVNFFLGLENFYKYRPLEVKFGVAYPGFHDFYQEGGWPGHPGWILPPGEVSPDDNIKTFTDTLNMALSYDDVKWIQVATWNDYGEGTMIEPTREFGNAFLNVMQSALGVPYGDKELDTIKKLYNLRQAQQQGGDAADAAALAILNEANEALYNLEPDRAKELLSSFNTF